MFFTLVLVTMYDMTLVSCKFWHWFILNTYGVFVQEPNEFDCRYFKWLEAIEDEVLISETLKYDFCAILQEVLDELQATKEDKDELQVENAVLQVEKELLQVDVKRMLAENEQMKKLQAEMKAEMKSYQFNKIVEFLVVIMCLYLVHLVMH